MFSEVLLKEAEFYCLDSLVALLKTRHDDVQKVISVLCEHERTQVLLSSAALMYRPLFETQFGIKFTTPISLKGSMIGQLDMNAVISALRAEGFALPVVAPYQTRPYAHTYHFCWPQ